MLISFWPSGAFQTRICRYHFYDGHMFMVLRCAAQHHSTWAFQTRICQKSRGVPLTRHQYFISSQTQYDSLYVLGPHVLFRLAVL